MVGGAVAPLLITHASQDPRFREHPGLHRYGIESYIAVPLFRRDGSHFGTLCALDPLPASLSEEHFTTFRLLADLISVRDHGVGVADGDLPHLFERKYRTADAVQQGISGAGLGLYIARRIVEAHGGQIWAEQAPGGGLQVCIAFPRV